MEFSCSGLYPIHHNTMVYLKGETASLLDMVIVSKHAVLLNKEFILIVDSESIVDLEKVQETTNKIDQLDEPMVAPAFDEAQIGNGEPPVPEDLPTLRKLSQVIHSLQRYDLLIINDALLIEKDKTTTYTELRSSIDSKRWQKLWNPR
ncbi:hypothetical protein Adt_11799 [Abeliophyllum distichum]|uniref:Uncharacterized protein n=1 Tax=Abeliophyllum distichum TaxID=126358 RepID=A0ABD1UQB2_9LAMI